MKTILNQLQEHFRTTPKDVIEKEWNIIAEQYADIGPSIHEFLLTFENSQQIEVLPQEILKEAPNEFGVFCTFALNY